MWLADEASDLLSFEVKTIAALPDFLSCENNGVTRSGVLLTESFPAAPGYSTTFGLSIVKLLLPKYRLGHTKIYLFILSKKIFFGSKYLNKYFI